MTGIEPVTGLKRIWQSLLVQLVCQALLLVSLGASDVVASWTGSFSLGYGTALVLMTLFFVAQMVAWVDIVSVLSRLKGMSQHFASASRWYLASFCLAFAYLVCHGLDETLQGAGTLGAILKITSNLLVTLRDVTPLVALWGLTAGYADYLDSLGEALSRLKSFRRVQALLVGTAATQVALTFAMYVAEAIAPGSTASGILSLFALATYSVAFIVQLVATAKARSVWKTAEEMLG